jgi:hypothetical protein
MPIKRISDQNTKTIEEFYIEISTESNAGDSKDRNSAMLAFLKIIDTAFVETTIWALTSLHRLVLLTQDDWKSKWYIIVSCFSDKEIHFEYLIPDEKHPWPDARVSGTANSLNNAKEYLLIAMKETNGWQNNKELESLLSEPK